MGIAFTIYTGAFMAYWIVTMGVLTVGPLLGGSQRFLEFMRNWIKPLFWMNFAYFIVLEILFSLVYWIALKLMVFVGFMSPVNSLFRFVRTAAGPDPDVWTWLAMSALLFLIIMFPYILVHIRLTKFFKRVVLIILSPEFGVEKAKLVGQAPGKLLPKEFVIAIIGPQEKPREWMKMCREDGSKKKFEISARNSDHMRWKVAGQLVDFWETQLTFNAKRPKKHSDGKITYKDSVTTYFDGLIIRIKDVMPSEWDTELIQVSGARAKKRFHRYKHKQGFFISLIEDIINRGHAVHGNQRKPAFKDYPDAFTQIELPGDHNITYLGARGTDLYLFVTTKLAGTMFDFNMNLPTQESLDLFREDLSLVKAHIDVSSAAVTAMESLLAETYQKSA